MDINRVRQNELRDLRNTLLMGRAGILVLTKDRLIELKWKHAVVCTIFARDFKLVHKIWCLSRKSHYVNIQGI